MINIKKKLENIGDKRVFILFMVRDYFDEELSQLNFNLRTT